MSYTRKLTPEQHTELRRRAAQGVKLKRLARDFGLAGPSSAFKYKWTLPKLEQNNEDDADMQKPRQSDNNTAA